MLDRAFSQFKQTGNLPPLRLLQNQGSGVFSISSNTEDCENGMQHTISRIPQQATPAKRQT